MRRSAPSSLQLVDDSDSLVWDVLEELLERLLQPVAVRERVAHLVGVATAGCTRLPVANSTAFSAVQVERIGHRDLDRALLDADRHDLVAGGDRLLQLARDVGIEREGREVDEAQAERVGEEDRQLFLGDDPSRSSTSWTAEPDCLTCSLTREMSLTASRPFRCRKRSSARSPFARSCVALDCLSICTVNSRPSAPRPLLGRSLILLLFGHFGRALESVCPVERARRSKC